MMFVSVSTMDVGTAGASVYDGARRRCGDAAGAGVVVNAGTLVVNHH